MSTNTKSQVAPNGTVPREENSPPKKSGVKRATIKYSARPTIPTYIVGDQDYGFAAFKRLFDWTAPELEWINAQYEEFGILDDLADTAIMANNIIEKKKKKGNLYTKEKVESFATQVLAMDVAKHSDSENNIQDLNEKIRSLKTQAAELLKQEPLPEVDEVVIGLMNDDQSLISSNLFGVYEWTENKREKGKIKDKILCVAMIKFRMAEDPEGYSLEALEEDLANEETNLKFVEAVANFALNEKAGWVLEDANSIANQTELKKRFNELMSQETA